MGQEPVISQFLQLEYFLSGPLALITMCYLTLPLSCKPPFASCLPIKPILLLFPSISFSIDQGSSMKKIITVLRKCRSFSPAALGRSSAYTILRSKSTRSGSLWRAKEGGGRNDGCDKVVVFVGISRRRYMIKAAHLGHPVIGALIDRSRESVEDDILVRCEVVLFDHLLWMLENGELEALAGSSLEELAALYATY